MMSDEVTLSITMAYDFFFFFFFAFRRILLCILLVVLMRINAERNVKNIPCAGGA
jgi:hypothetical protein